MHGRQPITAEDALAHADWVRKLARALAQDGDADDLEQDAWLAAAQTGEPLRGELGAWFTGVLRNLAALGARTRVRTARREAAQSAPEPDLGPDALLERLQTQQRLAQLLSELPEPVRSVLVLRYYEGLSSSEIAVRLNVPAGTVRWRLKSGLDELREKLDLAFEGDRARWMGLVLPLFSGADTTAGWLNGVLIMKANKVLLGVVAACVMLSAVGWWFWPAQQPGSTRAPIDGPRRAGGSSGPVSGGAEQMPAGLPAWLAQPGVASRRVAGTVLLDGKPVQGARVRLEPEVLPVTHHADEQQTNAEGAFDFGPRPALVHTVSASSAGLTTATQEVDLRDPNARTEALELRLTGCDARLVGRVLEASGGAIAHARVHPARSLGAEADAQGAFELCLPVGASEVFVDADGYGAVQLPVVVFGRTQRDIVLTPETTIIGRVVSAATGVPVAGALVVAGPGGFTRGGAVRGAITLSGPDGRFSLPVGPGEFAVKARMGNASSGFPSMVTTQVGRLSDALTLRLAEQSLLRGRVMASGTPVAGARVSVISTAGGNRVAGFSQRDGSFVIQGAPRGQVQFAAAPYAVVSPQRTVLSLPDETVTLEVKTQSSFHGVVTRAGKPVAFAAVTASAGYVNAETLSDANGRYALKGLAAGRYRLVASSGSSGGFTERVGELLADQEPREVDLELNFAASIAGQVVTAEGVPVAGAMVVFNHTESGDEGRAISDADGRFRCANMTGGGEYAPQVFSSSTARAPVAAAPGKPFRSVKLTDGASHVDGVMLTIKSERQVLRGTTVDLSGAPVPDVSLRAKPTGGEPGITAWEVLPTAISDGQGHFTFEPLPTGTWALQARAPDGAEATITNLPGDGKPVRITLQPASGIEGTLVGFTEPPAGIFATPLPGQGRLLRGQQDGATFRLAMVAGTYLVSAMNAHEGDVQRVEVKAGAFTQVKLNSHGRARLTGSIVDYASGAPVADLVCHLVSAADGLGGVTNWDLETAPRTDASGRFDADPAPAGEVHVQCVGDWNEVSTASALVTLAKGGQAELPLAVVRKTLGQPAGDLGLTFDDSLTSRATAVVPVIRAIRPASAGARAGLSAGDVVIAVDGRATAPLDCSGIEMLIINHPPGSPITMSVQRGTTRLDVTMTSERVQQ